VHVFAKEDPMLLRRILQFNLVVSALIAVGFVLFASPTLALYGIPSEPATRALAQYFGTAHFAFAVLVWFALRSAERSFTWAVVVSFFAGDVAGTAVLLLVQLRGVTNAMGWGLVGVSGLFAIAYGYCVATRRTELS
jgi:hypothetical protein